MNTSKMRFGSFIAPFHAPEENPTLALERDLELVELLDRLDYDEAWIGEHHSAAYETISSPEVFIAAAAQRTRKIRLGTGVSSLPYHHPLMLAERINQLDHMTRGRVMFGVGPGALVTDAKMMGIPIAKQRDRMDEALGVLVPLMRGEVVTRKTDWFELNEARLHLDPYTRPSVEMAVANQVSPSGSTAAGRHGLSLLSIGATSTGGFNALASNWAIAEERAAEAGKTMERNGWRLVGPMHIAPTREQARAEVRFGLEKWLYYFREVGSLPMAPDTGGDPVDSMIESGLAVIGTPDDAIAKIEQLKAQSGGFGCFLFSDHNWPDWEAKKKHYELFARFVMPHFQGSNNARVASMEWAIDGRAEMMVERTAAIKSRIDRHIEEKGSENIHPQLMKRIQR